MEHGDYLSTVVLKDAYRTVPISPSDRPKPGVSRHFDEQPARSCAIDCAWDSHQAPLVFSKVSHFIMRCAMPERIDNVINNIDDFCVVTHDHNEAIDHQHRLIISLLPQLGFYLSFEKVNSPNTQIMGVSDLMDLNPSRVKLMT